MNQNLPVDLAEDDAAGIIAWARGEFGTSLVYTCSFQNPVLVHLISRHAPDVPVVLFDTQYLFDETLAYARGLSHRWGFVLKTVGPLESVTPDEQWRTDADGCCFRRKVEPLNRVLADRRGWMTGIRRVDAHTRRNAGPVEWDDERGIVKVNPLVAWNDADIQAYIVDNALPVNPLVARGYASIGCWPCTRPVEAHEDRRAGRWPGQDKIECGLHLPAVRVRVGSS